MGLALTQLMLAAQGWQPLETPRPEVRRVVCLCESCWRPRAVSSPAPGLQVHPAAAMSYKSLPVSAAMPTSDETPKHTTCSCGNVMPEDLAGAWTSGVPACPSTRQLLLA